MTSDAPRALGLCRFQIRRDKDGKHRWYVFNTNGTMVGRHSEGFDSEREARHDAERFRELIARAPIVGEG